MKYQPTLLLSILLIACQTSTDTQADLTEEIATIENSLTLPIIAKGEKPQTMNIEKQMEKYNVAGASIAVVRDGKIRWTKGYGIANSETKVTTETLFQAGSISKPLAALAALKLAQDGKLDLDEDVNNYLKDWKIPESSFTQNKKVTVRLLLTHSAGLTVHGFPGYMQSDTFPTITAVLTGKGNTNSIESFIEPDSLWRYSGGGYTVMEKVVEDVSGMSLEQYMAGILKGMGMTNSTYEQPISEKWHSQLSAAYTSEGELYEGLWHNYPEQAAAGLWTTPTDLAKYYIHMQRILGGKEDGILNKHTVEQMLTKHRNDWGLGPSLSKSGDSLLFGHGGKNAGFTNEMTGFAYRGDALIIMTNSDQGGKLNGEVLRALSKYYELDIRNPREVEVYDISESSLDSLVGTYQFEEQVDGIGDYIVDVSRSGSRLVVDDPNSGDIDTLTATSSNAFIVFQKGDNVEFQIDSDTTIGFLWNDRFQFYKKN
ncbi:MAG: serine hydrolase domain-containing protein [Cyclobacteriaceae bacterium]